MASSRKISILLYGSCCVALLGCGGQSEADSAPSTPSNGATGGNVAVFDSGIAGGGTGGGEMDSGVAGDSGTVSNIEIPPGAELCPGVETDPAIYAGVLKTLRFEAFSTPTTEQLESVTGITATGAKTLAGVQCLPLLGSFSLVDSMVSNLSLLNGIVDLTISGGPQPRDLSTLGNSRSALRLLVLHWTQISDLSTLDGFNLDYLAVANSPVEDLSPLRGMPLQTINLYSIPASDLSQLIDTRAPRYVTLRETGIRDLSPLLRVELPASESVVDSRGNALARETLHDVIPQLVERGWCVKWTVGEIDHSLPLGCATTK